VRGLQVEALSDRFRHGRHLAQRFYGFLTARPLTPGEQELVRSYLTAGNIGLFWDQRPADQRHAIQVAHRVAAALPGDAAAVRAALLHDVGKRASDLGAVTRSVATVLDSLHLPVTARMRSYRDHGAIGAAELAAAGCEPLVVDFARRHPGPPPQGEDPNRWQVLIDADG
jgi:putative nucleotidyltransferase with HDIG domain